jgi:hypothetical protein
MVHGLLCQVLDDVSGATAGQCRLVAVPPSHKRAAWCSHRWPFSTLTAMVPTRCWMYGSVALPWRLT